MPRFVIKSFSSIFTQCFYNDDILDFEDKVLYIFSTYLFYFTNYFIKFIFELMCFFLKGGQVYPVPTSLNLRCRCCCLDSALMVFGCDGMLFSGY